MPGYGIRVEGLQRTIRELERLGIEVSDLREVFRPIAQDAADLAARFAPERTGRLRRSIRGSNAKNKAVVRAGRSLIPYAGPINYGWPKRNIAPSLFMQRASDAIESRVAPRVENELHRLFVKVRGNRG